MNLLDILKTASGNIWASKLRTFLTVIAIFIGAFTLTLTNGIGAGIKEYINGQVSSLGASNLLIIQAKDVSTSTTSSDSPQVYDPSKVQSASGGFGGQTITVLTDSDIAKIKAIPGITDVTPRESVTPTYMYGPTGTKYDITVNGFIDNTNLAMTTGVKPDNSSSEYQIALPDSYVTAAGFSSDATAIGQTVTVAVTDSNNKLSEVTATIVGVPEKSLVSSNGASINTAFFNKLYALQSIGLPPAALNKYPAAIAHFDSSYTDAQITTLKNTLDSKGYTGKTIADQIGILTDVINAIVVVFDIFAIITLLAASFGVINTLLMAVQERTKEIGLMKAMGMGSGRIFLLFSFEAILLGFWGSFLGVIFAVGVGKLIDRIASKHFLSSFQGLQLLAFPIRTILEIIIAIMIVAFLAGTLPARRASKLDAIEALRYE